MARLFRHLFARSAHGLYPQDTLQRITQSIADSESRHRGEICFAVEASLPLRVVLAKFDARQRALEVFAQLRVWNTRSNNGVLIYLLLADHRIEIVADRGLDELVSAEQWRGVCQLIEEGLKAGEPEAAVLRGIDAVSALLAEHFPRAEDDQDEDELSNQPHMLD
ncbi:MAG: TPM domain-containing protein [Lysobacter sp.]|nr:TPM domain-containing protein [Lysobacter sp.]